MSGGYGVLGEHRSDCEVIATVLRRLADRPSLPVRSRALGGKPGLLKDGAAALRTFRAQGCRRFVVCLDADLQDPASVREEARRKIVGPSGVREPTCVVVPVRAIEAWFLADLGAVAAKWSPAARSSAKETRDPERVPDPKRTLIRMSRHGGLRPRYDPPIHNPEIAVRLNLALVLDRCPSFRPLAEFVRGRA